MAGERLVQEDPSVGARVVLHTHELNSGTLPNAWQVLVDWGADGDPVKALGFLAAECNGGEKEAREILGKYGITV